MRFSLRVSRRFVPMLGLALALASCARDRVHRIVVSVPEQRMIVLKRDVPIASYPVSTSKFGLGDRPGSRATPLGRLEVAKKIGGDAPLGAVFKDRRPTGEVLAPDAPGRDPIVTRILWLKGCEPQNTRAYDRCIYIHGTPEERFIGRRASYGCIRMRSADVVALYETVGVGACVEIVNEPLAEALESGVQAR
jgi:L,D-transpeptidase-like protein